LLNEQQSGVVANGRTKVADNRLSTVFQKKDY